MGRKKGSANRKPGNWDRKVKDAQVQFRCTSDQREMINRISIETNQSVSDLILNALNVYGLNNYKMILTSITPKEINEVFT